MVTEQVFSERFIAHSRIPVIILDKDGIPSKWNPATVPVFPELETDVARGTLKPIRDYIIARFDGEKANVAEDILPRGEFTTSVDFPSTAKDGRDAWFRLILQTQDDEGFFCVIEDITEQRHREIHLTEAKELAEKASVSRSQFLANMSHEIRTPIQTIIGMMELLSETKLDEEQTEYARQVRFSADVMLTLINDILDISKIEAGQLKIERIEFDLADVIERTVDLVSMEAHKKGLEICIDIDPVLPVSVIGDPVRFRQILLNLVKNAVKFTDRGEIIVRAFSRNENGETNLHVDVLDSGIGVRSEIHDKLFNQFVQADSSTTRKYGGTGLGLAISRNIVELMHGSIGVKNNAPTGSIFWYDIPLAPAGKRLIGEGTTLFGETRFLIVDDNPVSLDIIRKILMSMGYADIGSATGGREALDELTRAKRDGHPFDIVFIDMVMPEMDGWRLAAEINKNHQINEAQLYMMVPEGSFGAEAKMKLLEWFNGYLYKPVKRRMLAELLAEHFQPSIDLEVVDELESVGELSAVSQKGNSAPQPRTEGRPPSLVRAAAAIQKAKETSVEPEKPEPSGDFFAKGFTVLIAEDHPVNRKLLSLFIEKTGAKVVAAEDGKEATNLIGSEKIDLVFMDIQMPNMNGYEAAAWMRQRGYSIPIVACTASAGENDRELCLAAGMSSVLPKPYKKQDIFDAMRDYLLKSPQKTEDATEQDSVTELTTNPDEFDGDMYRDMLMGDIDSARELAAEFVSQTEGHLRFLEEDIHALNRDAIRQTAHLLKGSALNMTAKGFANEALAIEKNADTADGAKLVVMYKRLDEAFVRLRTILAKEGFI
jgi:signal transduction histidine kinase/DNA-binding response OmpR family regulator